MDTRTLRTPLRAELTATNKASFEQFVDETADDGMVWWNCKYPSATSRKLTEREYIDLCLVAAKYPGLNLEQRKGA